MKRLEFLQNVQPFNMLAVDVLSDIADLFEEVKYGKDTLIYRQETTKMKGVDIIVSGEYESFFYDKMHRKRAEETHQKGFCYGGVSVLLNRKKSLRSVIAKKGTVVYFLRRKHFVALCQSHEGFMQYFINEYAQRMLDDEFSHFAKTPSTFEESYLASEYLYSRRVESVEALDILYCSEDTPAWRVARLMAKSKRSCIIVRNRNQEVTGYITDITLRDKVVAIPAMDHTVAASEIMESPVATIDRQAYVYEALFMMFNTKTRYLLVENNGAFEGIISRNRLLGEQAQSPMVYIQSVRQAVSFKELKAKWENVPQMIKQLIGRGVNAEIVNQIIATIADTILLKVIENVVEEVGTPPARFVFMVLGSEGRREQTLKTDQDNAIIYEDKANEQREEVRAYFLHFADAVSNHLDYIGFSFCTGGYMAKNPKWTHSLSHWKNNYTSWMNDPTPESVINFSTFFDCRYIYGDKRIMDELHAFLDEQLQQPMEKLFYFMAKNALQYTPPLTVLFKNIRTIQVDGQEVFDIKKSMTPVVDLVRIYALQHRIFKTNTGERLKALMELGVFTDDDYHHLNQTYYYLMALRLKNQAEQIVHDNRAPDNYIDLRSLTKIEYVTLKEIFKTIAYFQTRIRLVFAKELFG